MIPANDLMQIALDRLASQYKDSPNLNAVIALFVGKVVEARDAILELEALRRIDDSEGDGLDGIGQILGQPRELSGVVPLDFFELNNGSGGLAADGFGDLGDASLGKRFRSINESPNANKLLADSEYRQMLNAKIVRNQTAATPEDIIGSIRAVLVDAPVVALTFGTSSVTATIQRTLSAEELSLLNANGGIRGEIPVIPRPVGIDLTIVGI